VSGRIGRRGSRTSEGWPILLARSRRGPRPARGPGSSAANPRDAWPKTALPKEAAFVNAWQVARYGTPSRALELRDVDVPEPEQIRVATRASALNFNEVDGCYGRYATIHPPLPYTLGMEAMGVVDAVGDAALEGWLGRRVALTGAGATGAHAERVVGDAAMAFASPESLDDTQAAAFFFPFHLAFLALCERGGLRSSS
jgi:NADPH:quinone reductase-like Zn-dependent oxidoreductase